MSPESLHPSLSARLLASVIEIESCIYIEFAEGFSGRDEGVEGGQHLSHIKVISRHKPLAKWEIHVAEGVVEGPPPLYEITYRLN